MKTYQCESCDGLIAYVDCPGIPAGIKWCDWYGWFHIDPEKEHFTPVGYRNIEYV